MIKEDFVWDYYQKLQEYESSGMTMVEYCRRHEFNITTMRNFRHRLTFKQYEPPEIYENFVALTKEYLVSGINRKEFSKQNNIDEHILKEMITHVKYMDIIERRKQNPSQSPEEQSMKFVQVFPGITTPESQSVEKKNDIEIIITKGVKVIISPNIDSMKIMRIIELLKDL